MQSCAICGGKALAKNDQGLPVCNHHKDEKLEGLKCACGNWLDIRNGKYGPYFHCMDCGNIGYKKGLEMNDYPLDDIEDV